MEARYSGPIWIPGIDAAGAIELNHEGCDHLQCPSGTNQSYDVVITSLNYMNALQDLRTK